MDLLICSCAGWGGLGGPESNAAASVEQTTLGRWGAPDRSMDFAVVGRPALRAASRTDRPCGRNSRRPPPPPQARDSHSLIGDFLNVVLGVMVRNYVLFARPPRPGPASLENGNTRNLHLHLVNLSLPPSGWNCILKTDAKKVVLYQRDGD